MSYTPAVVAQFVKIAEHGARPGPWDYWVVAVCSVCGEWAVARACRVGKRKGQPRTPYTRCVFCETGWLTATAPIYHPPAPPIKKARRKP